MTLQNYISEMAKELSILKVFFSKYQTTQDQHCFKVKLLLAFSLCLTTNYLWMFNVCCNELPLTKACDREQRQVLFRLRIGLIYVDCWLTGLGPGWFTGWESVSHSSLKSFITSVDVWDCYGHWSAMLRAENEHVTNTKWWKCIMSSSTCFFIQRMNCFMQKIIMMFPLSPLWVKVVLFDLVSDRHELH